MDWKNIKCNKCQYFKKCKKTNTSKGSPACQRLLKLIPEKKKEEGMSKQAATNAMLWGMMQQNKKAEVKNEKEE